MGASSSTGQVSAEQKEAESIAASTGALSLLQSSFSKLSDPNTNIISLHSLNECFCLNAADQPTDASPALECFTKLLVHLGPSLVDLFFTADKGGVHWVDFLKGYDKCCGRISSSVCLNRLCKLYSMISTKAGTTSKLEFESDEAECKVSGYFMPNDMLMLLWMCWIMLQSAKILKSSEVKTEMVLPDVNHLILSAIKSCTESNEEININDCKILDLKSHISAQKLHMWVLTTVPGLAYCFTQYVRDRLQICSISEGSFMRSTISLGETSSNGGGAYLLTSGRAWAICLSQRNAFSDELLNICIPRDGTGTFESLLYRSSEHGKGLNRFWSSVEGYDGPSLMLISSSSADERSSGRWVVGVFTQQGFESRDSFYGSSGYLYAISPMFHVYPPSGKERNFVYTHLHPTGKYQAHPKPVGIGFGGTIGNERICMDEDFARIIIRHHAADKTYQAGPLVPNQGFLAVEASILEVEVWGLGGKTAKEKQDMFKKRETIFSEQRRKVELKNFGNWEDSPEKMMMDMVSDPNKVRREDR